MPTNADSHVALLPIHPQYAAAILDGKKRVEFRRRAFARPIDTVVVYATAPVCRVVGLFAVRRIASAQAAILWRRYRKKGGVQRMDFDAYFCGLHDGYAIEIEHVWRLRSPLTIQDIGLSGVPQSFCYLDSEALEVLRAHC